MIRDILFKLKVLFYDLGFFLKAYKENVWDVDLDSLVCCNGHMCGCMATTHREQITHNTFGIVLRHQSDEIGF